MTTLTRTLAGLLLGSMLAGCSSPIVRGRVIEGPINVTTLVSSADQRLSDERPGLEGATVELLAGGMSTPKRTVTDDEGRFKVKLPQSIDATGAISVSVEAEGYLREQTSVPFPPMDNEILVVVPKR